MSWVDFVNKSWKEYNERAQAILDVSHINHYQAISITKSQLIEHTDQRRTLRLDRLRPQSHNSASLSIQTQDIILNARFANFHPVHLNIYILFIDARLPTTESLRDSGPHRTQRSRVLVLRVKGRRRQCLNRRGEVSVRGDESREFGCADKASLAMLQSSRE
jgi:hypothetical protein